MNYFDVQELACVVLDLDYDTLVDEGRESEIDEALYEKFEISMDQFYDIVKALLPLTQPVQGGLSGTLYNAFVKHDENRMIVKQEFKEAE